MPISLTHIKERSDLGTVYFEDGAAHSAARVFSDLATEIKSEAEARDKEFGIPEMPDEQWKDFKGDFNSLTDEEIEILCKFERDNLDQAETWLEAVESWKKAGKPRS